MRKVFFGSTAAFPEPFDIGSVSGHGVEEEPSPRPVSARELVHQALRSRAAPYELPLASFVREDDGFPTASEHDVEIVVGCDIAGINGTHLLDFFVGGWACGGHRSDGGRVFVVPRHGFPAFFATAFHPPVGVFNLSGLRRASHPMLDPRADVALIQPRVYQQVDR
jgi:hypothetical protein